MDWICDFDAEWGFRVHKEELNLFNIYTWISGFVAEILFVQLVSFSNG